MPIVIVFMPTDRLETPTADVPAFFASVAELCTGMMQASPDKVQVLLVPVHPALHGPLGYVEVKFRHGPRRDPATLERFMAALDDVYASCFGGRPRIRCFAYGADDLFARN